MKTVETVKLVVLNPLDDVLLLRRVLKNANGPEIRGGDWELPGGEFEAEDLGHVLLAGGRELRQETGLELDELRLLGRQAPEERISKYGHMNRRHLLIARCALADPVVRFDSQPSGDIEHTEHAWAGIAEAQEIVSHPVQREFIATAGLVLQGAALL
jgi:8-oxo-dGTP pyrophosphatase MutT (NUDIX family)